MASSAERWLNMAPFRHLDEAMLLAGSGERRRVPVVLDPSAPAPQLPYRDGQADPSIRSTHRDTRQRGRVAT